MKTNNTTNTGNANSIDSSLQFKALDEIVSMIHSLTSMMNSNMPKQVTPETAFAVGDLNQLVNSLLYELEMVKVLQTRASAKEMSSFVVSENGLLKNESI